MKPMVILTGPTAVGKTELSIRLAKILDAEIISADSMQVYKKMDIGTAKIMPEEMEGIKHYLVDELDPKEEFHVARFQQMAKDALEEIKQENPLIFISTVLQNNTIFISIKDNAGGIPQNIITKIYDPYFTTKHKSQGTGLGLHMTYKLIDEGMHGKIEAQNVEFEYENRIYKGAEFIISLNLNN